MMTPSTAATCFVAIDLSKSKWLVALDAPQLAKIKSVRLDGFDTAGLIDLVRATVAEATELCGPDQRPIVCFETGYDGFWLQRLLANEGIETLVVDPTSFLVNRKARRVKTDRVDAEGMVVLLKNYCSGDRKAFRTVRVPTVAEEDAKRFHRERKRLMSERTGHINRIRALLALQGVRHINPAMVTWRKKLEGLETADGRPFPDQLMREIVRSFERLELTNKMIKALAEERDEALAAESGQFPEHEKAVLLEGLRGVGRHSAMLLSAEVFGREFKNRRHLSSYLGLTPSPYSSGDVERSQGISKAGNRPARTLGIELAWCWLRYQPQSALARWFRKYTAERPGVRKKVAIVALARKLIVALWRYVETGLVPSGAVLKAEV